MKASKNTGAGSLLPAEVKGEQPLWGLGQSPNSSIKGVFWMAETTGFSAKISKLRDNVLYGGMNKNDKKGPEKKIKHEPFYISLFKLIYKHPIISAALLCFFYITLTTGSNLGDGVTYISLIVPSVGIIALSICAGLYTMREKPDDKKNKLLSFGIMGAGVIAATIFFTVVYFKNEYAYNFLNVGLGVITAVFIYLGIKGRLTVRNMILLIMAAGFLIRLCYIISVPMVTMQHDVAKLGVGKGHIGYIEYLFNNKALPDFDVRKVYQFYHPPLHHIIAACWVGIQMLLKIEYAHAFENIQILTLFYSTLCMILSYKIFRQLKLKGVALVAATAIVALCPTFYIMAGSINNDILSITFMLGAVLNTIYWYKHRKMKHIIFIALCIGLGMMTKLSVWMVAPSVAFIFIYAFIKNMLDKDNRDVKKYITQYAVFLAICAPLGLWWSFRNYISHGVPFGYVLQLSEDSQQYVGNIPVWQRLFDFSLYQFKDVADQFTIYEAPYNEFNPLVGLFKTSMFDEGVAVRNFPNINGFSNFLFWSAVVIGMIGFVAMIFAFCKKSKELDMPMKVFLGILYGVIFISYYIFCLKFAHVCTQNIRYAVPLIVLGAYFTGWAVQRLMRENAKDWQRICGALICGVVTFYAICGGLVYDIVVFDMTR